MPDYSDLTAEDLNELINDVVKVNPAATDTSKLQGVRHRELLQTIVGWVSARLDAMQAETGEFPYDWSLPATRFDGYVNGETTFRAGFRKFMRPSVGPSISLEVVNPLRERGDEADIVLSYTAVAGTDALTSIVVAGNTRPLSPPSGSVTLQSNNGADTTYPMSAMDAAGNQVGTSASVRYRSRFYVFSDDRELGDPSITDEDLSDLLQSISAPLVDNRAQTQPTSPNADYMYIAYEASLGADASIFVNGIQDTSFTPRNFQYTNQFGFVSSFILFAGENLLSGSYTIQVA